MLSTCYFFFITNDRAKRMSNENVNTDTEKHACNCLKM